MTLTTLDNGSLRLSVLPEAGASVVALEARFDDVWRPLLRPTPAEAIATLNPSPMASFTLAPWQNRIPDARFRFAGVEHVLRANTPEGYAMHGDVRRRPWQVAQRSLDRLCCTFDARDHSDFNFPVPIAAAITYAIEANCCRTDLSLTNLGDIAMPMGFGFHPYFNRAFGAQGHDDAELRLTVAGVYPPLPGGPLGALAPSHDFSTGSPIGQRDINDCFGGWTGDAEIAYPSAGVRLRLIADPALRHLILYTPPGQPYFAVEPITHATNGFNLLAVGQAGTGVTVLEPGASLCAGFELRFSC